MILSHVIRRMQMVEDWPVISSKLAESIRNTASLPSVQEQADNLIRWLGDNHMGPGERVRVTDGTHGGMIGALTTGGFNFIIRGLVGEELIEANQTLADGSDIELTFIRVAALGGVTARRSERHESVHGNGVRRPVSRSNRKGILPAGGGSGAYSEAGYAEGLGKPVIYTCEESFWKNQKTHFDTNHRLHIVWSEGEITTAMERLKATIRVTILESKRGES